MELKPIENSQTIQHKANSKLHQNKNLSKKFVFDKEMIKFKEQKSIDKENFNHEIPDNSQMASNNHKTMDSNSQKTNKKNEEIEPVVDFREEIERRFKRSVINKIYIFPRKTEQEFAFDNSSSDSSNSSLKQVEVYDLKYQRQKEGKKKGETEQEIKNMSFQDFLSKIQDEKEKWKPKPNTGLLFKKMMVSPPEENLKLQLKNIASQNVVNKQSENTTKINQTQVEDIHKEKEKPNNFSMIYKRVTEDKAKVKFVKGRKVVDLNQSHKPRMNVSGGSNSKRKDNSNSNVFYAINSFHNKLFPKDKSKTKNSFQEFLQKKCYKKNISDLIFKNSMISNALKSSDNNNLLNNPLYSKAKKQVLIEKEYKNLYRSVEGLNSLKDKVLTENCVSSQSPKRKNKLGAFSDENRCRKEIVAGKKKENNMQKSYDVSKNSFKEFLMEHSQEQESNKTDRMIVLQNYLKENKDNNCINKM